MNTVITAGQPAGITLRGWIDFLLALGMIVAGVWGGWSALVKGAHQHLPPEETPLPEHRPEPDEWEALTWRANRVIEELIVTFPKDIKLEAWKVPFLFKERAEKDAEGYRTLGLYYNFTPGYKSNHAGPIYLFLKTIEEVCAESGQDLDDQIRITYLHELGHHFGWDEVDLAREGLPSGRAPGA